MRKKDIYVTGMFNNYALTSENKMDYNKEKGVYEKAIIIKQGFTNYEYTVADSNGKVDYEKAIDGNFIQTENNYTCLVYYRGNNDRYDRIIGRGMTNSIYMTK
jgi:1,4-alpha-glucan branching enzyme